MINKKINLISIAMTASVLLYTENTIAATAIYSQDTGIIEKMYTNASGDIAITLQGGFQNAITTQQCPTNIGWAGNYSASNILKAALIAAKSSGLKITVTTAGCEGSSWFKIIDIYW